MKLCKNALQDYNELTKRINDEIVKLGEFYMEVHGINQYNMYVDPRDGKHGFFIRQNSDDEERAEYRFRIEDLLDPDQIKKDIIKEKKEVEERTAAEIADRAILTEKYEREFLRLLKEKYEGKEKT